MSTAVLATPILTQSALAPAGHYTQAVVSGDQVFFISGQLPIGRDGLPGRFLTGCKSSATSCPPPLAQVARRNLNTTSRL